MAYAARRRAPRGVGNTAVGQVRGESTECARGDLLLLDAATRSRSHLRPRAGRCLERARTAVAGVDAPHADRILLGTGASRSRYDDELRVAFANTLVPGHSTEIAGSRRIASLA